MSLTPFTYEDQQVRVIQLDSEPWFVLTDLAKVLEIAAPARLAARLDEGVRQTHTLQTAGGPQQMTIVSEPGMYEVVIRSDKPEAAAFRRWITSEVLPSIRKTGRYAVNPAIDEHRTNATIFQARARIELLQAARGLIHPDHLEAHARCVLAIGLGEHAELPTDTRPLYTQDYLREKGVTGSRIRSIAGMFGKRVKAAYTEEHGAPPAKYPLQLGNGQVRDVLAYTEQDRPLLDAVYTRYYSEVSA